MNKNQFLNSLKRHLSLLNSDERKEIISFYEDRFNNAIYEGKTEQDIINELETPEEIAKNVLNEYGIEQQLTYRKSKVDPLSIMGLLFFDLFISSWLLPVAITIPLSLAATWLSYFFMFGLFIKLSFFNALLAFVLTTAIYIIYLILILLFMEIGLKITLSIVDWHIRVFTGQNHHKTNNASIFKALSKIHITNKVIGIIGLISIIVAIISSVIWFTTVGPNFDLLRQNNSGTNFGISYQNDSYVAANYDQVNVVEMDINNQLIDIELDLSVVDLEIYQIDTDKLRLTYVQSEDPIFKETFTNNKLLIKDTRKKTFNFTIGTLFDLFPSGKTSNSRASIKLEIPRDLEIAELYINKSVGTTTVEDAITQRLVFNGSVSSSIFRNIVANHIDLSSSTGRIELVNSSSSYAKLDNSTGAVIIKESIISDMEIDTSTGHVIINESNTSNLEIDTSTGDVKINNLNISSMNGANLEIDTSTGDVTLNNVYILDVDINTSTGDVDYYNDDSNFVLDSLNIDTSTGDVNHNIPNKRK